MNFRITYTVLLLALSFALSPGSFAQENDDTDIRLNPEIEDVQSAPANVNIRNYPFINRGANHIDMNGHSWAGLKNKLGEISEGRTFSIVHIGDSHIQAEGNTTQVRKHLQKSYGDAGRGLIIPFRLAGTNQPLDYRLSSTHSMSSAKLLKTPWSTSMGFTGISLATPSSPFTLTLSNEQAFNHFAILGKGHINVTAVTSDGQHLDFHERREPYGAEVTIERHVKSVAITISAPGANIFGIYLRNGKSGILYNAIGNNGAAYVSYNQIPDFGKSLEVLHPDLVIISLGTNEAFGRMSDATFYNSIKTLVEDIRVNNPGVEILLTTPSECQRSVWTRVRSGRKKRRRSRRIRSYAVNQNVARMASVIRRFGKENHIPVYDFYEVAGGQGASAKWVNSRLLAGDRIHRTWTGYRLEGDLLHEALVKAFGNPSHEVSVKSETENNELAQVENSETMVGSAFSESANKVESSKGSTSKVKAKAKTKKKTTYSKRKKKKSSSRRKRRRR